ncbi:MAG: hypothetical protein KJ601_06750, partial [Nanoarchaeota archaeon]|nr:hypothetical protein [Nanoarchaeota archaeon]
QSSNDAMRTRYQEMEFPGQGKIQDMIERLQPFSFRTETQYYDENLNLIPLAIGTGEEAITINSIPVWWNGRYKPITERQVTELVVLDKALSDSYEPHTDQRKNHPDAEAMIRTIISTDLSALGINTEINIENLRRVYGNTVYSYFGKRKLVSEKAYQNIAQLYTSIEQAKSDNKLFQRTQRWSQSKQPYREIARPFYDMLISELKMTLLPRELEDAYRLIKGTSAKWGRDGKRKRQYNFKDRAQTVDESFFNYVVDDFVGGLDRYLSGKELALTIDDTHPTMHNLRQDYDDQRLARQSLPDQQKQRENDQRLQVYQKTLTHVVDVFNRCLERYDKKA